MCLWLRSTGHVVEEAVAAQGAFRVLGEKVMREWCCKAVRARSASQLKERRGGSAHQPDSHSRDLLEFEDPVPLCGLCHQGVLCCCWVRGGAPGLCAEVEAVWRHRARVVGDLAPVEAKTKEKEGGGRGLETDELGHERLRPVQLFHVFAETEVWGAKGGSQQREARVVPDGRHRRTVHGVEAKAWLGYPRT